MNASDLVGCVAAEVAFGLALVLTWAGMPAGRGEVQELATQLAEAKESGSSWELGLLRYRSRHPSRLKCSSSYKLL